MRRVVAVVITLLVAVYIPLAAFMVVSSAPVSIALMDDALKQTTTDATEREYLLDVATAVREFSFGDDAAAIPTGEDYRTALSSDEITHLLDVRLVFLTVEYVSIGILFALILLLTITVRRYRTGFLGLPLIAGGGLPLAAALILSIVVAVDFNAFFAWMHSLFFADGTWVFPADSLLIRSLPSGYWLSSAGVWAGSMVLLCAISIATGLFFKRREARVEQESGKTG
ncbi:MAG: DUF1461 domain-containing protein [Coriobacteriales bacterium]|jgi:integral membrane protein (TIGR01906 family)|nr:DUF1461 domain-containing protein [Coriobacteriales bacterium]